MYKYKKAAKTTIRLNQSYVGERLEQKINRIVNNKEPIKDGAEMIYTERKDGVLPQYDIKTDRWEIAVEAMDKVDKSYKAKREERHKPKEENKENSGTESTGGTVNENKTA